jgi:hypothetical protein
MLRQAGRLFIDKFTGVDTRKNLEKQSPASWPSSLNVGVNADGSAEPLRSPLAFNNSIGSNVFSLADYLNPFEHRVIFDAVVSGVTKSYKIENDLSNTLLYTSAFALPYVSLVANDQLYRINKSEFLQLCVANGAFSWNAFGIGVSAPAAAPAISYTSVGTASYASGVIISYAYMNSQTGSVSIPSPHSNQLAASSGSQEVAIPVVASGQAGVDTIILFATEDGGSIPYLVIDSSGDTVTYSNSTTTLDVDIATLQNVDTLTPEPIFNELPPSGAQFMFMWKNHVFLTGFDGTGDIPTTDAAYSALEACYIGVPTECYPSLNRVSAFSKGEQMWGGIATQFGALLMSDLESYLLEGQPTDQVSGPTATTAVSQLMQPMNWGIGTKSPRTIQGSPYGQMWLDQAMHVRLWNGTGIPTEIGLPLRGTLANLDPADFFNIEGKWFQFAQNGGVYVIKGKLLSGSQHVWWITIYQDDDGTLNYGYGESDAAIYSLQPVWASGTLQLFAGTASGVSTWFNRSQAGSGWSGNSIYFDFIIGNENNYQYFHSLVIDGDYVLANVTVSIREVVKSSGNTVLSAANTAITLTPQALATDMDGSTYYLIDSYGRRKVIRIAFSNSSDVLAQIKSIALYSKPTKRIL